MWFSIVYFLLLFFIYGLFKWEREKKPLKDVPMQVHGLHERLNDQFMLNSEQYQLRYFARPAKQVSVFDAITIVLIASEYVQDILKQTGAIN